MKEFFANLGNFVRRWPYSVTCAVIALLAAGGSAYWQFFKVKQLEESLTRRSEEYVVMFTKQVGGKKLEQELADLRVRTKQIEDNLVVESNLAVNLWYFYNLEEQSKAQLPELHQVSSPASDKSAYFRRVPYGLRVLGTYEQVAAFLFSLETGPRLVKITSFNLARADAAGQTVTLDLNVELLGKK